MSTVLDRVKEVFEESHLTRQQFADKIGLSLSAVNMWWWVGSKRQNIRTRNLQLISEHFGVSMEWLKSGMGDKYAHNDVVEVDAVSPLDNDIVCVKQYHIDFGCGLASEPTYEEIHESTPRPYPRSFFQQHNVNPSDCKIFRAIGDSMTPYIMQGDYVLVECINQDIIYDYNLYAIVSKSGLMIKQLRKDLQTKTLTIHSINPNYTDVVFSAEQANEEILKIFRVLKIERDVVM